jgi:hypothetical protein
MGQMALRWLRLWLAAAAFTTSLNGLEDGLSAKRIGTKVSDLVLAGPGGEPFTLASLRGHKAVVVVVLCGECPVARSYLPVLAEMAREFKTRSVAFVGVLTEDETPPEKEALVPFPIVQDRSNAAARSLGASTVPEAFLLDGDFVLRYRGRIDDSYSTRLRRYARPTHCDLHEALDDLLAGRTVRNAVTTPVGCPLRLPTVAEKNGPVTFYRDVLPILQRHCQQCHRPGEAAPFSLLSYRQAARWSADLQEFTRSHRMPPWKPVEGGPFHGERRLSEKEIATLAAWADSGVPGGEVSEAPAGLEFPAAWQLGTPDLVLTVPAAMTVGPSGDDLFRIFVLPTGLASERDIAAVEVRPGNRRIVHHALVYYDRSGKALMQQRAEGQRTKRAGEGDCGPGYTASMGVGFLVDGETELGELGAWAPGQRVRRLPEGVGYRLPRGADVLLQIHYHRNGRVETDQTSVGVYFASRPVARPMQGLVLAGRFLFIPPGDPRFRVNGAAEVSEDCVLYSILPHMHRLGREIKVTLTPPHGPTRALLAIRDWDFNWQEVYYLEKPMPLIAGSRLDLEAVFDNSAANPANPFRPPRPIVFGKHTDEEMCFVYLGVTPARGRR